MSHETLPSKDAGNALDKYENDRRALFGKDLYKTGLKAAVIGLFAVGATLAKKTLAYKSALVSFSAPLGLVAAGVLAGYGVIKAIEGGSRWFRSNIK